MGGNYIGATGLDENQEQFDILKDEIDGLASYQNTITGYPDPTHTAIFGINPLNPNLFGLVERAEVKIKLLETAEEGLGTDVTGLQTEVNGLQTEVNGIQTEVSGIQTEITGIQGQVLGIEGDISTLNGAVFLEGGAIALVELQAADALTKANRALDIWDYSGDNVYHKKTGNVGIGTTFGSVLTNKLEVNGNINIPTGSTFRIGDEPFNYTHLAGEQPVSSKWTNATDTTTNIYYNTGNVGIGVTTAINNKLEVNGNLNISAGSKYKINNVNLAFSDLGGTLSYNSLSDKPTLFDGNYNSLTNQLTGGTNIQILNGAINNTYTYTLPTATTAVIGGVRPDGTTILITNGVISSTGGLPATIRLTPTPTDGFYSWINSQALLAKTPSTGVLYSSGSADGDIVLRSDTDKALILQSGIGDPAITFTGGTNRVRIHQRVGINTLPNTNYWLDVNGSINATEIRVGGNLIPISQWITSGANIYYSSGNVGIGTNTPNYTLHLHKTSTAQDVRIQLTDGTTTTGLARGVQIIKGTDNQGYLYNFENNSLVLGTNATERMRILANGNIGIGISPSYKLDVNGDVYVGNNSYYLSDHTGTASSQFFGKKYTNTILGGMEIENTTLGGNYSQKLHFHTHTYAGTYGRRMTINEGGYVGVGTTNPQRQLHIQTHMRIGGSGPVIDFGDDFNVQIYRNGITNETRFTTSGIDRFIITGQGLRFQQDVWHANISGNERFFFGNNSTTYIKGHGGNVPIQFRNGSDTPIAYFENDGQFVCSFQTRSVTDTDHLVVANNTNLFAVGQYKIHIAHNTFTGFHRCYYEDDEIFNNNMLKEEIDIFKNNYKGRIVISTGKIKTDFTRDVPKTPTTQNEKEEVKIEEGVSPYDEGVRTEEEATEEPPPISSVPAEITTNEWYSAIDKDGITIEDAIPIVQLCRIKKDKRVYGVLGSPTRSTNNLNRLIVNSVGEGAICVCNTNGNIENGDYIQSSELLGFGEKQDDDILHNYSVAKAVMDCTFDLDSPYYQCYELEGGVKVAFIACTYHCG